MIIALTGTPGTGKSSVAKFLAEIYEVKSVSELAEKYECILGEEFENDERVLLVDLECLSQHLQPTKETVVIEGHLAHFLPSDLIIVLRCNPLILKERLNSKKWREEKILENVEAELLDVILIEAMNREAPVYEIDTTNKTPREVAGIVIEIIEGERRGKRIKNFMPGKIDWIGEVGERIDEIVR